MKRATGIGTTAVIAIILLISSSAFAQNKQAARQRLYTPQVKAYSDSHIITGRIARIEEGRLVVDTARGSRFHINMDAETLILEAGEEVSIASLADISLSAGELKVSDGVEVVIERAGRRRTARIITRMAKSHYPVARR